MAADPAAGASKSDPAAGVERRQRTRSVAIALCLGALVLIFYAATIIRLGPNALRRDEFAPPAPALPAVEAPTPAGDAAKCKEAGTC
ncbi:MAG: hypothetical protein ACT4N2_13085 [Hyphomicrobium sp.]